MASTQSLAPGLLLAAPRLGDPNFERTVVLLARHDSSGALGWVINGRALGVVRELLGGAGLIPTGVTLPEVGPYARSARQGGPVQRGTGWVLYRRDDAPLSGSIDCGDALIMTGDMDALHTLLRTQDRDFRLFLGYAGWGPDQLEGEIAQGVWLPVDIDADLIFDGDPEALWDTAYQRAIGAHPGVFMRTRGGSA
jgi:putative transcriptional regulator